MLRSLIISAMLGCTTLTIPAQSFAAEEGAQKLSKKERKALKAKHSKMGAMASMCIGSLAMSTLSDEALKETPEYQASLAFWSAKLDESVSHVKPSKREKLRKSYDTEGSAALSRYGNGNIILGGKKAAMVCGLVEAENFEGPTTYMLMDGSK